MNRVNIITILFIILSIAHLNCWNKQGHDITRPEIPRYTLSGTTVDYDTGEPVPFSTFNIIANVILYDVSFASQSITSDSNGQFSIFPVYPGNYHIIPVKNHIPYHTQRIGIQHADTTIEIKYPDIMMANLLPKSFKGETELMRYYFHQKGHDPVFCFNNNTAVIPCEFFSNGRKVGDYFCLFSIKNGLPVLDNTLPADDFDFTTMQALSHNEEKFIIPVKNDSLAVLNKWTGYLEDIGPWKGLKDLDYHLYNKQWFGCTNTEIVILNNDFSVKERFNSQLHYTQAITCTDKIYLYDFYNDVLVQYNDRLQIEKSYALINASNNQQIGNVSDLDFNSFGELWVVIK